MVGSFVISNPWQLRMTPQEIQSVYHKLKWKRVLEFQTRNPIQRLRFEMTVKAIRQGKANLLLVPVTGMINPGDFDRYKRARYYRAVPRRYSLDSFELYLLPLSILWPDPDSAGESFYESQAA